MQRSGGVVLLVFAAAMSGSALRAQPGNERSDAADGLDAQATLEPRDADAARFFVEGAWNSINEPRSGVVEVHEVSHLHGAPDEEADYYYAFDVAQECVRFDFRNKERLTRFARNEQEALLYLPLASGGSGTVVRYPRDHVPEVHIAAPMDFRTVPLRGWPSLRNKSPIEAKREFFDRIAPDLSSIERLAQTVRLTWHYSSSSTPREGLCKLVVDRSSGMRPVLYEEHYRPRANEGQINENEWVPELRTETKWEMVSSMWVPVHCKLEAVRAKALTELSLVWTRVNEPVPEGVFRLEDMDVADGTAILNEKLGEPIFEERVGSLEKPSTALAVADKANEASARTRWTILIANLVVIVIVVIVAAVWRRKVKPK